MILKRILYGFLILVSAVLIGAAVYINSLLPIITGYAAKNLASDVFISGRTPEDVENTDLNFSFIKFTRNKVDFQNKSVTSRFLWGHSKAIYRDGFGVTLVRDVPEDLLQRVKFQGGNQSVLNQDSIKWPLGNVIPDTATGIDRKALDIISRKLITDNAYNGNAFAFMVLHKGIPVAEAYKPQFNMHTRFLSWSIAKSFTNALVGILVRQGRIDINKPLEIDEWKNDERSSITLNDLMQMQSGLKWNEDYGNRSDVTLMLHCEKDMAQFAYEKPEDQPEGKKWYYSSGSANIISYGIRKAVGNDSVYYQIADNELFNKTGMPDAVFEVDPTGTMVGSSYLYATARDYARFALLYLNDGVFNGERILPEGWVKYTVTPASASGGQYGSLFWLNRNKSLPSAPEDMYSCQGHDGQRIFILPSQDLAIIIFGYSPTSRGGMDFDSLIRDILNTIQ
jgi:CubicO group peptidase (beta-lactamase class C family)